ncbi:MAG: hypothetical protein J6B29_01615 [Clostridia bacterium]|nr:hypothetical protein [Clostridia bacterium]
MTEGIKSTLIALCSTMSVSGHEYRAEEKIKELCADIFDEIRRDSMGTVVMIKRCNKKNAPKLLIDAHLDTVGMMVTDIKDGGFLKVVNIGGLDTRVLPATEVTVYGRREIYGLITSTPPHLRKDGEDKLPKITDLMIDTGYTKEELEEIVSVGDMVGYRYKLTEMAGGFVTTSGLDDKACACGIIEAMRLADRDRLCYDVYVTISAQEETGKCGVARASFEIEPDIAIITDVNFARGDGSLEHESIQCRKGAAVDISALTDKALTRNVIRLLRDKGIKHQIICEPGRTYTNNEGVLISGKGVRTMVLSVPLKNMHTPCETVNLEDIKSLGEILLSVAYEENL